MLMRSTETLDNNYSAIKKKIDSDYNANQSLWQVYWTEATIDTRLESGDAGLMTDLNPAQPNGRTNFYFNRVRPICNMVSGYQRRNRKSTIVVPLENGDQKTADQWSKILLGVYKREGVYETISDAFHQGPCITGMNLLHVYMDYKNDPVSGDIKVDNLAYNSFFIDPYFRKPDLSDCSFVWRRSYLSHSAAAALMPDRYEEIMELPGNPTGTGRDGKFQYMPESYGQTQQNRLAYDEYYYRSYRTQKLLVDKETGESFEITNQENIDVQTFLEHNPQVTLIEQDIPTVRLAIMIQDKVFYDGPNPLNIDTYPFVPVLGYYNPMMPYFYSRIQGICRSLRDPQMLYNRKVILTNDAVEAVASSGFIFKENAVIDVKHLFQTGAGRIIPLKEEAQMTDIQQITPPNIPPYFFQLQDTFSKEMNMVSGVNEELMGSALDDKAGILSALRQGAGLTTLQPLFDRLDFAQNMLGEIVMKIIQSNYVPSKIRNLLEGEEPAPLFYNKAFGKYHCMVEMGFNTESQKQMQFAQLVQLKEMGVPLPDSSLLEASTIQNKTKIIETMQQQAQQAQQMQQAQIQSQIQEQQARTQLAQARTIADRGLGAERFSRIEENAALADERKAAAAKDDQQALLSFVKAIKEIEGIDIDQIHKLVNLQKMLQVLEAGREQSTTDQTQLEPGLEPQQEQPVDQSATEQSMTGQPSAGTPQPFQSGSE
jgi:hypothetical protein